MTRLNRRIATFGLLVAVSGVAQAVTFSNIIIQSPPLNLGSSHSISGNAISFFTPNASVGDAKAPLRSATLNIQYDAQSGPMMIANQVGIALGTALLGTGTVSFVELVMELDGPGPNANELGLIGFDTHVFSGTNTVYSNTITFSKPVKWFRAKKAFTLDAPNSPATDLAALAIVNQNIKVVPEPASIAAMALGVVALASRRRRK
ncbi:MAG: PEP-CTERM sorting domain-containing protein [Chthonomonas sp.]|nr:PEP-CTERM sorting domain-containing protein [Chthonomonas sp.]